MGRKKVIRRKKKTPRHKSQKPVKPSGFSILKQRISGFFSEIVKAPEKVPEVVEKAEESSVDEPAGVPDKLVEQPEEIDEEDLKSAEREKTREKIHQYVSENLNEAVSKWKETGDIGLHLEVPVPFSEKVRAVWSRMAPATAFFSAKLKTQVNVVVEKIYSRMKKAEAKGQKVDIQVVVDEEWKSVLGRIESVSSPSEREEIDKIYKELVGK